MDERIALEMAVSRELMTLRLIERALHDHTAAWAIGLGGGCFPAAVEVTDRGVEFVAEVGWGVTGPVEGTLTLWCDDEPVMATPQRAHAEPGELLTWGLSMRSLAAA